MFKVLTLALMAAIFYIFTGVATTLHFFGTSPTLRLDAFFVIAPFFAACLISWGVFQDIIYYWQKKHAGRIILRELDPDTGYLVRGKINVAGDTIISVMDITTEELLLAELATYYPPVGFTVEKTRMGKDALVPIGKKLLIGNNCGLSIVSAG